MPLVAGMNCKRFRKNHGRSPKNIAQHWTVTLRLSGDDYFVFQRRDETIRPLYLQ